MKKVVSFLVLMLTLVSAYSQSLQLKTKEGKIISNGDLVFVGGMPDAYMMLELDVQNISDQTRNVLVKKYTRFEAVDSVATFCWGLCFPWFVTQSPDAIPIEPGAVSHDFSTDYAPAGVLGHTRLGFTFFVADNPNDSISVEVEFAPSWFTMTDNAGNNLVADQWINLAGPHTQTMSYDLVIKNNALENKAVQFKRIEKSLVPGTEMFFCWGACFPSNIFQLPEPARLGPGESTEGVTVDYDPKTHSGTSIASYVVYDADHPEDSLWINFAFDGQAEGIENSVARPLFVYPNPAGDRIFVEIPQNVPANAVLRILSLQGQVLADFQVQPGLLKELSLKNIPVGTCLLTLVTPEGTASVGKIVIRK